jgi:hypothetical protein
MSLNPNELNKAKKLLNEITEIYKSLGESSPFTDISQVNNIQQLNDELKIARDYVNALDDDASSIFSSFKSITEEISGQNKAYNTSSSSLKSLTSISQKLRDHQVGISKLSVSQLQNLQSKAKSEKENLKINRDILQDKLDQNTISDKELVMLTNINGLLGENDSSLQSILHATNEEVKARKIIEKQLGVAGGIIKGINKIPILGDVFDAKETLEEMEETLKNKKGSVSALGVGFKNIGKQLKDGALNSSNMMLMAFTFIISTLRDMDKGAGEFAKNMNVSYSEALQVREEMGRISTLSGDAALSANRLLQTHMAMGKALGTNAKLNEADAKTMTKLVQQTGYQYDELMNIQKLSLVNGKTLEDNTKEILGGAEAYATRNGIVVNEKEVLKEVNKSSKALQLSLGQNTKTLSEAVVKAKQFGLNLEQAASIAENLLNFEQSIEGELQAELLTGKNLNFERARQLALEGKVADAAAEVASQLGNAEEFGRMNVIQQEAIAKSVGMTRETLASSLIEREALQKIGAKDAEEARKKYDALVSQFGIEEAQKRLGDEQLALQFEQQNNAEKFTQAVEKIKDIFVTIVDGPLGTMLNMLSTILSSSTAIYGITGAIAGLYTGKMLQGVLALLKAKKAEKALSFGSAIIDIIKGAWSSLGGLPVVGPVLAGAAIAGAIGFMKSQSTKGDDIMSPGDSSPGYGKRTLFGPEGAIELNNKDTVIAGTNLFGNDKKQQPIQSQPSIPSQQSSVDMTQTNALLQQLISVIQSGGTVTLDGQKVGTALKLGTYQVQ